MADLPEATTRQDQYLKYIAENGSFSGGGGGSNVNVVQTTGDSETDVMSQKSVTDNLNLKVDKINGKQLSTEDYTTEEKTKLSGIESQANKTVIVQTTGTSETDVMSQKATTDAINKTVYNSTTMESGIDLNTKTTTGFYMVDSTCSNLPNYDGSNYSLIVSTMGDTTQLDYPVFQIGIPTNPKDTSGSKSARMYIRQKYLNVDTWAWTYWLNASVLVQNSTGDSYEDTMSQSAITSNFLSKNIDKIEIGSASKAGGTGGISIGQNAESYQTGGISIGQYTLCPVPNSIALGANSQAMEANVLSIGNAGATRKIINVTDPTNPQDAVTKNYLEPVVLFSTDEEYGNSSSSLTLNDDYTNYARICIYAKGNKDDIFTYTETLPAMTSYASLHLVYYYPDSTIGYVYGSTYQFSGNTLNLIAGSFGTLTKSGYECNIVNGFGIAKIVGYRY